MRCRKVRSCLSAYCRGEMAPGVAGDITRHIDSCPSCRREAEAFRAVNRMLTQQPVLKTGDEFSARLFARIANENFAEKRDKAYLPGRIPLMGASRLAVVAATAVIVLLVGAGINLSRMEGPSSVPLALSTSNTSGGSENDLYLTVQPTHNPLLNSQKSVSRMVQQYNRWRELSRVIRSHSGAEQFMGNGSTVVMASSGYGSAPTNGIRIRPVVKNYLFTPENGSPNLKGDVY
jgi:hypothetical protein